MSRLIDADKLLSYMNDVRLAVSPSDNMDDDLRRVAHIQYGVMTECMDMVDEQETVEGVDVEIREVDNT